MQATCAELVRFPERLDDESQIEVEVRLRLEDDTAAIAALEEFDLVLGDAVTQDDQAYAPVGWDYSRSRIGVTFVRLRTVNCQHWFTVKRPITDVRTCIEYESQIANREAMHDAVLLMGFKPTVRILKRRRRGTFGHLSVCLDDVDGLGLFLEMEAVARPGDDIRGLRAALDALLERLEIDGERCFDTYDALIYKSPRQLSLV